MRIISWNLLRLTGAGVDDVAALIERHRPDLLLLQEATEELTALPAIVGGHFFHEPLDGRDYGLAAWSPHPLPPPCALSLPASQVPGRVPPRVAQMVELRGIVFANVHLSHGQLLNRLQLLHIVRAVDGPAAVVGDYNAVGPIKLAGFRDIGPRQPTHTPNNIIWFRLDRCMARGLRCTRSRVLDRGPSDHHPIILDLQVVQDAEASVWQRRARVRPLLRASTEKWLRAIAGADQIRVPRRLFETLDLRLPKVKRRNARGKHPARTSNNNLERYRPDARPDAR